ncbi:Zinc finger domain 2 [Triplophysa tibetana]|uniref:Zinc finger domain 2 n=1 Tax=Triplophysa tibetana TaxID=1572043 RepID=A0A5A9NT51_9TELE|nr:Zinc finger domain 2 [Triplophysa tibetana]
MNHCFTVEHRRQIFEDTSSQWKHRDPAQSYKDLKLCERSQTCEYGDNCMKAHSKEELEEWKKRIKDARKRAQDAADQGLLSYQDHLLEEYRHSKDKEKIERLEVVVLLKQDAGAKFTLNKDPHTEQTYSMGDWFLTSEPSDNPKGEVFAVVHLSKPLTPDTPQGYIMKRQSIKALVKVVDSDAPIYEAVLLKDTVTETKLHLQLSKQCCTNLNLENKQECEMEVQFQLNRLWFCEMHKAIDDLRDLEKVLPDLKSRTIHISNQSDTGDLNEQQKAAMNFILSATDNTDSVPPLLIYGPFGTGKTMTLANMARTLVQEPQNKILICTHTNSSADLYVETYFHQYVTDHPEVRPLRIKAMEKSQQFTDPITRQYCHLSKDGFYFEFPDKAVLDSTRIIITTTSMARYFLSMSLPEHYFSHILIDEASQMLECEALMALGLGGKMTRVVLAGDHMQMGPKLFSVTQEKCSDHTLLSRLFYHYQAENNTAAKQSRIIFSENYRSTKDIVDFVSEHFYEMSNQRDVRVIKARGDVPSHPEQHALQFHHVRGECHLDPTTMSWFNAEEIQSVVDIVQEIMRNWPAEWKDLDPASICVLSQGRQVNEIRKRLRNVTVENAENVQDVHRKSRKQEDWCYKDPDEGVPLGRRRSHRIIEELMIMFNHTVADRLLFDASTRSQTPVRIARLLIRTGIQQNDIAVLTPYNAQVLNISETLRREGVGDVIVNTIMKSQGSEWKYVILSTVRSCPESDIEPQPTKSWITKHLGFIMDPHQLNVAITRAQEGLCIIDKAIICSSSKVKLKPNAVFGLCINIGRVSRSQTCEYGDNCMKAHSKEELEEWKKRIKDARKRAQDAADQGLLSYQDHLLEEYRHSKDKEKIERLEVVVLLKQDAGAKFTLNKDPHTEQTYSMGDWFLTSEPSDNPKGEVFAVVHLSKPLTPDTPQGYIMKRQSIKALVKVVDSDAPIYEAVLLKDTVTETKLHLQLSKQCCTNLNLENKQECEMEVQFQLNRLWFCEMHKAIDDLRDLEKVLPDLKSRTIHISNQSDTGDLNEQQKAAMNFILSATDNTDSVPPLLIYGPFGTGKTMTLANMARTLVQEPQNKILICTHTNSSADLYVETYFHQYVTDHPEVRPLRIKAMEKSQQFTDPITRQYCHLSKDGFYFEFPDKAVLDSTRIIITTTSMARYFLSMSLPEHYFSHILIDEASQMLECEALMALGLGDVHRKSRKQEDWCYKDPDEGVPLGRRRSHRIIEELMIMFNHTVADRLLFDASTRSQTPVRIARLLIRTGTQQNDIAVLTPYNAQVLNISEDAAGARAWESEWKYVILSTVRSCPESDIEPQPTKSWITKTSWIHHGPSPTQCGHHIEHRRLVHHRHPLLETLWADRNPPTAALSLGAVSQPCLHLFVEAPVEGVLYQAGQCNVAWVARGDSGQADWSPWALARSTAFRRGPLKNHLLRGHTHPYWLSVGDGVFPQARPPDLERL